MLGHRCDPSVDEAPLPRGLAEQATGSAHQSSNVPCRSRFQTRSATYAAGFRAVARDGLTDLKDNSRMERRSRSWDGSSGG
jgi:hypothetical protein